MKYLKLYEELDDDDDDFLDKSLKMTQYFEDHLEDVPYLNGWKFDFETFDNTCQLYNGEYPDLVIYATPNLEKQILECALSNTKDDYVDQRFIKEYKFENFPPEYLSDMEFFDWYFKTVVPEITSMAECSEEIKKLLEILIHGEGKDDKLDLNIEIDGEYISYVKIITTHHSPSGAKPSQDYKTDDIFIGLSDYKDKNDNTAEMNLDDYDINKICKLYHILAKKYPYAIDSINSGYFNLKK